MQLCFDLSTSEVSELDLEMIRQELDLSEGDDSSVALSNIAKCAFLEYRKMFIERGLPTKAAEVMQERLFYLIKGLYVDHLPYEQQIASIFQLTSSGSKTLLKNTISRYRVNLQGQIKESIRRVLRTAEQDESTYYVVIQSETIKDEINKHLTQNSPTLTRLLAVKGSAGQFYCPDDTMRFLRGAFGIAHGRRSRRS